MTCCVYALAARGARPGRGFSTIAVGRVAAIVREARQSPRPTAAKLRAYDGDLRALAARIPALLPARFGTCIDDPAELVAILGARQQTFRAALRTVRGRVQMTVRLAAAPAAEPEAPRPASGAAYLRARAAARAVPEFDPLRRAVRRWVREERVERTDRVATVYHLVPRGSAEAYRSAVLRASAAAGMRVRVSGPFPPYAFATTF